MENIIFRFNANGTSELYGTSTIRTTMVLHHTLQATQKR